MIKSLTGFGSVEVSDKSNQLTVLIRSVNARYLDIKFRGIDLDPQFELEVRKDIQDMLIRGSINIQINFNNNKRSNNILKFDKERYEFIEQVISTIQKEYGKHVELGSLISVNDLIVSAEADDLDTSILKRGIKEALKQLESMRKSEGELIGRDMTERLNIIKAHFDSIKSKSAEYVKELNIKYKEKLNELVGDIKIDDDRIAMEVAILVDKYDFTEEIVRGLSHCEQFSNFLNSNEPIGKKMNFLLQELSREANTVGSKSPTSEISNIVVEIKSEIEKIREQVQNIL